MALGALVNQTTGVVLANPAAQVISILQELFKAAVAEKVSLQSLATPQDTVVHTAMVVQAEHTLEMAAALEAKAAQT
jgi:hypothetical protein